MVYLLSILLYRVNEHVGDKWSQGHNQGCTAPDEVLSSLQKLEDTKLMDLLFSQAVDPLHEGQLPCVELQDFDSVQNLWDESNSLLTIRTESVKTFQLQKAVSLNKLDIRLRIFFDIIVIN